MPMCISPEGVAITERFFKAIQILIDAGRFRGLKTFTTEHGLNRRNLQHIKDKPENTVLKPEVLSILIKYHNVSAMWLITGEGAIFQDGTDTPPIITKKKMSRK